MHFLRRSLIGLFLIGATLGLLALAGNTLRLAIAEKMAQEPRSFPQRERVPAVDVVTVTPGTITPELSVFGELRSRRTVDLRSPSAGIVVEVGPGMIEGGTVQAGDLLLRLDPVEAQAALDRARADMQDAAADQADADRALALAQDELTAAAAQADLRQQALARAQDLLARGAGTAAAVEDAQLSVSTAAAAVLTRRQSLAQAQTRVDQAATSIARAQLSLDAALRGLENVTLTAAFDGTVSGVSLLPGSRLTANEVVAQLVDPALLELSFRVSTAQYTRLLDGDGSLLNAPVAISLDAGDITLHAQGRITRESAEVGEGQTGRLLFAELDSAKGFRSGDFVTVRVTEPPLDGVAHVPATAIGSDGTVLVLDAEDRLAAIPVSVLRRQGDAALIMVGDLAGQRIVAKRSPLVGAGIKVTPVVPGQGTTAAAAPPAPPEMIQLDPERRAKLVAFVTESRMPPDAKTRILSQLEQDQVPAETVARIESRMGG